MTQFTSVSTLPGIPVCRVHPVPFDHIHIYCTMQTHSIGWKYSSPKHSLIHNEPHRRSFLLFAQKTKQTPWSLVHKRTIPSDRHFSAKFSANFCGQRSVAWSVRRSPMVVNLSFLDRSRYFSFRYLLIYAHEAKWTLFQTHCYAENSVVPGNRTQDLWLSSQELWADATKTCTCNIRPPSYTKWVWNEWTQAQTSTYGNIE
jgi:hypothetical protein